MPTFKSMPREHIEGFPIITYDYSSKEKIWPALSKHIQTTHGKKQYTDHAEVQSILDESYSYLIKEFRGTILDQPTLDFFLYVFHYHEVSIKIWANGYLKGNSEIIGFARYRRILKLILEQGIDIEFEKEIKEIPLENGEFDSRIQELIYIGTWIYEFADMIAYHKMINNSKIIEFDKHEDLSIQWHYHYGIAYKELLTHVYPDYQNSLYEGHLAIDLKKQLLSCFEIDFDLFKQIAVQIKERINQKQPEIQLCSLSDLKVNLFNNCESSAENVERFISSLLLTKGNKMSLEELVYKPYSMRRFMFRPILSYKVNGQEMALIGEEKLIESLIVLATNSIQWNQAPEELIGVNSFKKYIEKIQRDNYKSLENKVEEILKEDNIRYVRNVKSLKQPMGDNYKIDNPEVGEIDFIAFLEEINVLLIIDAKYNRARYEGVGYRMDWTNFINNYEPKLTRKVSWIKENIDKVEGHFGRIYNSTFSFSSLIIQGIFVINTPTFYMFNGNFLAITINQFKEFINGNNPNPILQIHEDDDKTKLKWEVSHPYFYPPETPS